MGIKTFWYLTQADGDYPWSPGGLFPVDGARQIELAKTIDDGGFRRCACCHLAERSVHLGDVGGSAHHAHEVPRRRLREHDADATAGGRRH